ncbi:MAG: UDP-glucose--hexose-1-phosphate uridylyltransferase [Ruminococcaceae bacterium]|nr:UDP-glucose--hexose-1-phosphate uridylyltransferase [Oscillospiraceae bacterium]
MNIYSAIKALANYALRSGLIEKEDYIFSINSLCQALGLDSFEDCDTDDDNLETILKTILDWACENGLCENSVVFRDLFDTKLMGILTPRPSDIIKKFNELYDVSPKAATDYYYEISKASDYIRTYRIKNDVKWITKTEYGDIDITINLSKPEKDPKAIAAALKMKQSAYPKCQLCKENEGYMGRVNHPARQNHRIIPIELADTPFFLQYSPYVYYNEHCIVFNSEHIPMVINREAFDKLLAFVERFPHYFVGSNADLPIVGGSILTHEHFQGGNYEFAMAKAPVETPLTFAGYEDVAAGIVKWPMSVIRISSDNKVRLAELADKILTAWRGYTDADAFIYAETDGEPHNTITPIARMRDGKFELDLVLRNNITTDECPLGFYHPHPEYHHIKKENIGLIEVMGLAVLPSRLKEEIAVLADAMVNCKDITADERIAKHSEWAEMIMANNDITADNCEDILKAEIGKVFTAILGQCGVFERNETGKAQFVKFAESVK